MAKILAELAAMVGGEVVGDQNVVIRSLNGITQASEGELTFLANPKYVSAAENSQASAILVDQGTLIPGKNLIRVKNPSYAFAQIASVFMQADQYVYSGIHASAVIAPDAKIGGGTAVGPCAVIEPGARIGANCVIGAGCYVGYKTVVGESTVLFPNVTLREKVQIGNRVIIHSGSVIGCDGFGYEYIDGEHKKIPQVGIVVIEDDVEIGANVTIDRARFDKTWIKRGTKIDNLVQIAHNVIIEENCIIISQAGISGSTHVEKNVILAGQSGVAGHLTIGAGAIVSAQAGVTKSVPAKSIVSGYPAKPHQQAKRLNACLNRLPLLMEQVKSLKQQIQELKEQIQSHE